MDKAELEKLIKQLVAMKETINKGNEEADRKYAEAAEQVSKALAESQDLQVKHADLMATNEKLATRVEQLEKLFGGKVSKAISVAGLEGDPARKFSLARAFYAISTNDWKDAGFEKEVFAETAKKAMNTQDDSSGGFIVPTEVTNEIIEVLRPKSVLIELGATTFTGLTGGAYEIPAGKGGIVTYWVGEGMPLTESEESFGQVVLRPKEIGAMVRMSLNFAKRAMPDAENYVRGRLAKELGLGIDLAGLMGQGGDYKPLGLWYIPGIPVFNVGTGGNGGQFLPEHIIDLEGKLEDADALEGKLAMCFHPKIRRKLMKTRVPQYSGDTKGDYIYNQLGDADQLLRNFLGYPYSRTTQLPTNLVAGGDSDVTPIFFGNWEDFFIGQWGSFEIAAANQAKDVFEKRQMLLRITQEVDMNVGRKESFTKVPDAKSS